MKHLYRYLRRIVFAISVSVGVFFFIASILFLIEPSGQLFGLDNLLVILQDKFKTITPFNNLYFIAIFLVVLIGFPQFMASLMIIARMKNGIITTIVSSFFLIIFSIILDVFFTSFRPSWILLVVSILEFILSILYLVSYYQYHFYFNEENYLNLGGSRDTIVIYFSKNDYIRKHAYEVADSLEARIVEIKPKEKKESSYNIFRRKKVEIEEVDIDFRTYRNVHIIIPSYASKIAAPIKTYLENNKIDAKRIYLEYITYLPAQRTKLIASTKKYIKKNISSYFFTTMSFGVVQRRIQKRA